MSITAPPLGDPVGMRPSQERYWDGYVGEYLLGDGRTVWATWVPYNQTHCHVVVWDDTGIIGKVERICRLQAARANERVLVILETGALTATVVA